MILNDKHVIEHGELENDKIWWECHCGVGGSCDAFDWEIKAERHIPEGEGATYRYGSKK